jgi:hypothetical protein
MVNSRGVIRNGGEETMINKDERGRRDRSIYSKKGGEHDHIYVLLTAVKIYRTKEEKQNIYMTS